MYQEPQQKHVESKQDDANNLTQRSVTFLKDNRATSTVLQRKDTDTGTFLIDNRPKTNQHTLTGPGIVQRVLNIPVGKHVEVNEGGGKWYGNVTEAKYQTYLVRVGGTTKVKEIKQQFVSLSPEVPRDQTRELPLIGTHGTNREGNIRSLTEGLDYEKQMNGGGDHTEAGGPGFYLANKGNPNAHGTDAMDVPPMMASSYNHRLNIYARGLNKEAHFPEDRIDDIDKSAGRLVDDDFTLTHKNHPQTTWFTRNADQGRAETVIRPHLYNKGQLLLALRVASALNVFGSPTDHLKNKGEIDLKKNNETGAFINETAPDELNGAMNSAEDHHATENNWVEVEDRPGLTILKKLYGELEMPASVYKILVNVAEFDFHAEHRDPAVDAHAISVHKAGKSTGENVLPTKDELKAIIDSAKAANPSWYA